MFSENNNSTEFEESNEDFASMFEQSLDKSDNFSPGDKVEGVVVQINNDNVLVDISGKSEATIDITEFLDKNNQLTINKDDKISAYVVSTSHGEIQLTSSIGKGYLTPDILAIAYEQNIPIQGLVSSTTKGGFRVTMSNISCFCPISQMDIRRIENEDLYLNNKYDFKIIEFKNNGKNIIVSRRVLLEEIQRESQENLKKQLNIGDTISATINKIADFGIFVDIGGLDALIPRSELSLSRIVKPSDFEIGASVKGKIIDLNWDDKKFTLSIKQTMSNPWDNIAEYENDKSVNGTISNIISKGAFVEIIPGLEGFIPISKMSYTQRVNKPEDVVSIGNKVKVKILDINKNEQKLLLELISDEGNPWLSLSDDFSSQTHLVTIESTRNVGLNIRLKNGIEGFIPRSELNTDNNTDIQKQYSIGKELSVNIIEYDIDKKKLIASEKLAKNSEEQKEFSKHMNNNNDDSNSSSLGSMFQDVFKDLKKNIDK